MSTPVVTAQPQRRRRTYMPRFPEPVFPACDGTAERRALQAGVLLAAGTSRPDAWMSPNTVGLSATAMVEWLTQWPVGASPIRTEPMDFDDFKRCLSTLERSPMLRERRALLVFASPRWHRLIAHTDDLLAYYHAAPAPYPSIDAVVHGDPAARQVWAEFQGMMRHALDGCSTTSAADAQHMMECFRCRETEVDTN